MSTTSRSEVTAQSIYRGVWKILADLFYVPKEPPTLPVRADEAVLTFQPADGFLRYLKMWFWIVAIILDILLLIGWVAVLWSVPLLGVLLFIPMLGLLVLPDIVAYVALHLRYDTTWYVVTDRSVRIRRGIWIIREVTITFENVQNIHVRQGPVQRMFGIQDLVVETAGAGSASGDGATASANQGILEGIDNAAEMRDLILDRVRQSTTAGLGDEGPLPTRARQAGAPSLSSTHIDLIRSIRDELASAVGRA